MNIYVLKTDLNVQIQGKQETGTSFITFVKLKLSYNFLHCKYMNSNTKLFSHISMPINYTMY